MRVIEMPVWCVAWSMQMWTFQCFAETSTAKILFCWLGWDEGAGVNLFLIQQTPLPTGIFKLQHLQKDLQILLSIFQKNPYNLPISSSDSTLTPLLHITETRAHSSTLVTWVNLCFWKVDPGVGSHSALLYCNGSRLNFIWKTIKRSSILFIRLYSTWWKASPNAGL